MALDRNRLLKLVMKLRKLVKKVDREATPTEIHELRTNARRFEAAFEALSLNGHAKSMLKSLGRFRKRAGKVRDMDVFTAHASTVHLEGEEDCAVQLLEHLGARRLKQAKKLYAEIRDLGADVRADLKHVPSLLAKQLRGKQSAPSKATSTGATANAVKLAAELAVPKRLRRDNLHPYRLKVKELRDVLQMTTGASPKFVDDLGKVKDAIGDWHDWEELVSIAEKALTHGNRCGLLKELKRIAQQKYQNSLALIHTLRQRYLRSFHPQKKSADKQPVWQAMRR